jgi:hypothetical protein
MMTGAPRLRREAAQPCRYKRELEAGFGARLPALLLWCIARAASK